jgi:hypothetical protein
LSLVTRCTNIQHVEYFLPQLTISSVCALNRKSKLTTTQQGACGTATVSENKIAGQSERLTDSILEDKIADIWPDYPCFYDVRSPDFKTAILEKRSFSFFFLFLE